MLNSGTIISHSERVFVGFTAGKQAQIKETHLVQMLHPDLEAAVLQAGRQLPILVLGRPAGQPVRVTFTAPLVLVSALGAAATEADTPFRTRAC